MCWSTLSKIRNCALGSLVAVARARGNPAADDRVKRQRGRRQNKCELRAKSHYLPRAAVKTDVARFAHMRFL